MSETDTANSEDAADVAVDPDVADTDVTDTDVTDTDVADTSSADDTAAADTAAADTAAADTPAETVAVDDATTRSARKVRDGVVTSSGMDKTIVVTITERVRHAKYNKFILKSKRLYTHDETNDAGVGDKVRVMETRPMSKNKRWRLIEIMERAR